MAAYTRAEVSLHNTSEDLWIIVDNKVYNMTQYVNKHPGGKAILRNAGKDSSVGVHTTMAHQMVKNFIFEKLREFYIGELKD